MIDLVYFLFIFIKCLFIQVSKDIKYADNQPIVPWGPRSVFVLIITVENNAIVNSFDQSDFHILPIYPRWLPPSYFGNATITMTIESLPLF